MNIQTVQSKTIRIFQKYGVQRASLFGSIARGENRVDSDVDILVEMPQKSRLFDFLALQTELEEVLSCKVDLVDYKRIRPRLKPFIIKNQKSLYRAV